MKSLIIEVVLKDSKVVTAIRTKEFDNANILDQFALLGILENTKDAIRERIKTLASREK